MLQMNYRSRGWQRLRLDLFLFLFTPLYGSFAASLVEAQEVNSNQAPTTPSHPVEIPPPGTEPPAPNEEAQKKGQHGGGALVIVPLPISSPALGSGIVPVVSYIFPISASDKAFPPSVVGGVGLVTDNGTRAVALGGQIYFAQDTYHTTGLYARGNLNYDLYGLGSGDSQARLPLKQTGQLVFGEFLRRTWWKFFLGPRFFWGSSLITRRPSEAEPVQVPPDLGFHTTLTAIGFRLNRDTRPNRFYPTAGTFLDFTADFFSQGLGSKYSFQSYKLAFNKYFELTPKQVLASGSFACLTGGEPPFYANCAYGTNSQLRGYTAGRYLDRYMFGTQLEYRLALYKKLGLAAFGGLGEVVPGGNQLFRNDHFLPSGGAGVRFELSKTYHVNLRVDFAQGRDSHTWIISVGEAF
jgi:hypothetical protein